MKEHALSASSDFLLTRRGAYFGANQISPRYCNGLRRYLKADAVGPWRNLTNVSAGLVNRLIAGSIHTAAS